MKRSTKHREKARARKGWGLVDLDAGARGWGLVDLDAGACMAFGVAACERLQDSLHAKLPHVRAPRLRVCMRGNGRIRCFSMQDFGARRKPNTASTKRICFASLYRLLPTSIQLTYFCYMRQTRPKWSILRIIGAIHILRGLMAREEQADDSEKEKITKECIGAQQRKMDMETKIAPYLLHITE